MKCVIVVFILVTWATACQASLITVSGNVSGTWSVDTVMVIGDVTVPAGQTLTIQPGVEVQFTGLWKLLVNGQLDAVGTVSDSIIFTRAYPTEESKWRGLRLDGADNATLLEYCRIEWAKGTGAYPAVHGGCVWINNCSPTVRHCRILNGYSHNANYNGMGGAISFEANTTSVVEYCHILLNQADSGGGICVGSSCNPTIRHNLIENNQGFYSGGGIYVSANGQATIYNNVIRNNTTAGYGGGGINLWSATWMYGTQSDVYNNLITGNNGGSAGGGIYSRYESSTIRNNTFTNNQATNGGGVYVLTFSNLPPTLSNNILWNNTGTNGAQIFLDPQSGSTANVSYCDVQGGWPGTGNLDADPFFVMGPGGSHYLSQIASGQIVNSPCVDAGDPLSGMITGTTRTDQVQDAGVVDMGYHYEISPTSPQLAVTMTPINPPIVVPANGGSFNFDATVQRTVGPATSFYVWARDRYPDGSYTGNLLGPVQINPPVGVTVTRQRTQVVPSDWPAGLHHYIGYAHTAVSYPATDADSFSWTKSTAGDGGITVWEAANYGEPFPGEEAIPTGAGSYQPSAFSLLAVHPNPFNPTTGISYELRAASYTSLKVYDISGRLVATLVDGWKEAGTHEVTFDGSGLASGLYMVRMQAGEFSAMKKMMLVK
jgi:hypothetical protein